MLLPSKKYVLLFTQCSFWTREVWIHSNLWNIHWTIASLFTLQVCISTTPGLMHWIFAYWNYVLIATPTTRTQQTLHLNPFNITSSSNLLDSHPSISDPVPSLKFAHSTSASLTMAWSTQGSYLMLSPCSWQSKCLNTGILRLYIILLSTTTLPFVTPTQSAVDRPPSVSLHICYLHSLICRGILFSLP
jgi:hypothetical protein